MVIFKLFLITFFSFYSVCSARQENKLPYSLTMQQAQEIYRRLVEYDKLTKECFKVMAELDIDKNGILTARYFFKIRPHAFKSDCIDSCDHSSNDYIKFGRCCCRPDQRLFYSVLYGRFFRLENSDLKNTDNISVRLYLEELAFIKMIAERPAFAQYYLRTCRHDFSYFLI